MERLLAEVAIVVTGEPIDSVRERCGGYGRLIQDAIANPALRFVELDARAGAPSLRGYGAVVITGSAASVTERAPWLLALEEEIRSAVAREAPLFGICFGHQLLGQALGGHVTRNPRGREIGTLAVEVVAEDPLLPPGKSPFFAHMTHVDSVVRLPRGAKLLGRTELDGAAVVRYGTWAWGVQFHPEMDDAIIAEYVAARSDAMTAEGLDVDRIRREVQPAPVPRRILQRFVALSLER